MTMQEVFPMEYRLSQRCMEDKDFYEGVRASEMTLLIVHIYCLKILIAKFVKLYLPGMVGLDKSDFLLRLCACAEVRNAHYHICSDYHNVTRCSQCSIGEHRAMMHRVRGIIKSQTTLIPCQILVCFMLEIAKSANNRK